MNEKRIALSALLLIALSAIGGCGQTGPLMLPQPAADNTEQESDEENER
jgi:predicted small lipoprotein YifL